MCVIIYSNGIFFAQTPFLLGPIKLIAVALQADCLSIIIFISETLFVSGNWKNLSDHY